MKERVHILIVRFYCLWLLHGHGLLPDKAFVELPKKVVYSVAQIFSSCPFIAFNPFLFILWIKQCQQMDGCNSSIGCCKQKAKDATNGGLATVGGTCL